jgi:para-nitrobenzyl esterase
MSEIVETSSGRVRGAAEAGVLAFKGIPYTLAPVGARRFAPPEPAQPWSGLRAAAAFGAQAWQVIYPFFDPAFDDDPTWDEGRSFHRGAITAPVPNSEDCLVVNVWTPSVCGKRPVMVWMHGGGFTAGGGSWDWWCGQNLARGQDLVIVSLNHRLNIFGFLYAPEHGVAPNLGMQDIVAALRWVQANIASFGGDAGNITIFGQSGGGMKVSTLMAMPSARGLFHKAIVQSGPFLRAVPQERARVATAAAMRFLGIGPDQLREVPAPHLLRAFTASNEGAPGVARQFGPVADGDILPRDPFEPDAPATGEGIPLLIGATSEEITSLLGFSDPSIFSISPAEVDRRVADVCGVDAAAATRLTDAYRGADPSASPSRLFARIASDRRFGYMAIVEAERQAARGPTWSYRLTYQSPLIGARLGAAHNIDLPLLFRPDGAPGIFGTDRGHNALSAFMQAAWAEFARSGDPGWKRFDTATRATMMLDRECQLANDPGKAERLAQAAMPPYPS